MQDTHFTIRSNVTLYLRPFRPWHANISHTINTMHTFVEFFRVQTLKSYVESFISFDLVWPRGDNLKF